MYVFENVSIEKNFGEVHRTLLSLSIILNKVNPPINPAHINVSNVLLLVVMIVIAQIGNSTSSADVYYSDVDVAHSKAFQTTHHCGQILLHTASLLIYLLCHQYAVSDRNDLNCADGHFYKALHPIYISMPILQLGSILVVPIFTQFL